MRTNALTRDSRWRRNRKRKEQRSNHEISSTGYLSHKVSEQADRSRHRQRAVVFVQYSDHYDRGVDDGDVRRDASSGL